MPDPRITHAANWLARFTVNGVTPSDFHDVLASIERWEDWCRAWSARAKVHEDLGLEALEHKHFVSAGEHLARAAVTYHFAKYLFVNDMAQMRAAHRRAVACLTLALPHLDPPGERVVIPYEGKHLVGTLRRPDGIARPPLVLMTMGLDSTKEELLTFEDTFLRRGMATLAFDGPGQGEAEYDFAIRADYEAVTGIVIDWVEKERKDIDSARIGIWGISLGGYYAPRSAAFEKRHQGLHRELRSVGFRRAVGLAAGIDAPRLHRPQPQRERYRGAQAGARALARRRCGQDRMPAVRHRRRPRPAVSAGGCEKARRGRPRPGRAFGDRGRQSRRPQPLLQVSRALRGLDGKAARCRRELMAAGHPRSTRNRRSGGSSEFEPVMRGLVPRTPLRRARCLTIGVAGTGPAMAVGVCQPDQKLL